MTESMRIQESDLVVEQLQADEFFKSVECFWMNGLNVVVEQNDCLEIWSLNKKFWIKMWNAVCLNIKSDQIASVSKVVCLQGLQVCALHSQEFHIGKFNEQIAWNESQLVARSINNGLHIRVWSWVVSSKGFYSLIFISQSDVL